MPHTRQRLGDRGEQIAERFLAARGYTVLRRKYRCAEGEIDLVCRDGNTVTFVEVKTRRGTAFGAPEEAVTPAKLAHIAQAGQQYLTEQGCQEQPWRIDVVAVEPDAGGRLVDMRLIVSAADW
ncbi:MAG TPA: YraN family protein [Chloroflexota bacterium]|nr:YraN family protein [Chloroflexota bacterium]